MNKPPAWLAQLANEVARFIHPADVLAPLGCHFYLNRAIDQWEVSLFLARTEIVGGRFDGQTRQSRFDLDIGGLLGIFGNAKVYHWQALSMGEDDELGPHVSLEGAYQSHNVWLRILAEPPERFEPGRTANAYSLQLVECW